MPSPLSILLALLLVALHFWWRARFRRAQQTAARAAAQLLESQEQAARRAQAWQEAVFNGMVEGLLLLEEAGRIRLANPAFGRLFALTGDQVGKTLLEVLRWPELSELVAGLDAQARCRSQELPAPGPNELWLQVGAAAIFDSAQRRQGTLLVFHDVTRLKHLERARGEFVANVSHELRTPLSHIKGYGETLLAGAKDDPVVATRFLETIERNARRLQLLIEDLLSISELESGRVRLEPQPVALRPAAQRVCEDSLTLAAARNVTLVNDVSELVARADPVRLEQVLANLVDNAIKYGREGGRVAIRARAVADGQLELAVQDDGPGLPAAALERAFERFYRVDKARSREQGGTGLGLAIVKHIVQSHGGRVWAASEPGQGATFFFTLPAATT